MKNKSGIVEGHSSSKLSKKGLNQANKLAEHLSERDVDAVYSSDTNRAIRTAQKIAENRDLELNTTKQLREVDRSKFEGKAFERLLREVKAAEKDDYQWKPDGGESLEEAGKRCLDELEKIRNNHQYEKVAVVSHSGSIGATLMHAMDRSARNCYRISQENCAINHLEYRKRWQIHSVNDTCHLRKL